MIETIFSGVTAASATVAAIAAMISAWFGYLNRIPKLTMKPLSYYHAAGSGSAQVSFTFESSRPVYVRSITCHGRQIAAGLKEAKAESVVLGVSTDRHPGVRHDFWISPLPKDGEPLTFTVDTGNRFFKHKFTFWANDFSASGCPDRGRWPV